MSYVVEAQPEIFESGRESAHMKIKATASYLHYIFTIPNDQNI